MRNSLASHGAYEVERRFLFPHVTGGHRIRSRHASHSPHHGSHLRLSLFLSASRHAAMVARGRGSARDTARSASARSASVRSAAAARFAAASRRKHSFLGCRCCCADHARLPARSTRQLASCHRVKLPPIGACAGHQASPAHPHAASLSDATGSPTVVHAVVTAAVMTATMLMD